MLPPSTILELLGITSAVCVLNGPHLRLKDSGAFVQPMVNPWPINHFSRLTKVTFGYPDATNSATL